jgi:hypothetical protein
MQVDACTTAETEPVCYRPSTVEERPRKGTALGPQDVYADLFDSDLDTVAENVATAGLIAHL